MNGAGHVTMTTRDSTSPRLRYAAGGIAVVAGLYALGLAWFSPMGALAWGMGVLGVIVLAHGALLFTAYGMQTPLGDWSGTLMILYGLLMFAHQAWVTATPATITTGPWAIGGADGIMIFLALAMLATGALMLREKRVNATPRAA
jgi:hypothetical protein